MVNIKNIQNRYLTNKETDNNKINAGLVSAHAITLITLVITIVLLIILSGVTINMSLGNNNIFTRAKQSKEELEKATIIEQIQLEIIDKQILNDGQNISWEDLEEILAKYGEVHKDETGKITGIKTTEGGYEIPLEDILDGERVKDPTETPKENEITSIELNKKTLQIVEGSKETLTTKIEPESAKNKEVEWISDNEEVARVDTVGEITAIKEGVAIITVRVKNNNVINDKCTVTVIKEKPGPGESGYEGKAYNDPYIPIGFKHIGTDDWNHGYTIIGDTESQGNEFVWVPCVLTEEQRQLAQNNGDTVQIFGKTTTGKYIQSGMGITGDTIEANDIATSVGTYQGFYIAKYEAGIPETEQSVTENHNTSVTGNILPVSKPNVGVWNFITRADAISLSNKMINYEKTGVHSTLISGAAWDTTLQWIKSTTDSTYDENSTDKGNYSNSIAVTSSNLNEAYAKNNIYDMAGNIYEWTTENCIFNENSEWITRGRRLWR